MRRFQTQQQFFGTGSILNVGGVDMHFEKQTERIAQNMPFSAVYFLTRIVAARPPFSVVLTDWLSKMAALASR